MTIRPDSDPTAGTSVPAPPAPAAAAPRAAAAKQQPASGPMSLTPQSEPSTRTKVASRSSQATPAGAYVVQLSAQKSESEAQASYRSLQEKYPSVLGGREASIRRAEIGQTGTWYRVQVGSFTSSAQAEELCGKLRAAGGQCIVQRN
jgi:cell division septation protein DedD